MKNSFPKRIKRHYRKLACNTSAKFKDCALVNRSVYTLIYKQIYEELFSKT